MKIGLTGATGQVGRELAFLLQGAGRENRLLVRDPKRGAFLEHETSELVRFDFGEPGTFEGALEGIEGLFLVFPGVLGEETTGRFARAAKRAGVKRVVVMSGVGADRRKDRFLSRVEGELRAEGIPYMTLRANWFFQNFGSFFREMIVKQHELTFPDGGAPISFVDARDIAEVAFRLLDGDHFVSGVGYDITGPESLTHAAVADLFSKWLPYSVGYRELSEKEAEEELGWNGEWLTLFQDIRDGITAPVSGAVEQIMGKPPRRLEAYIEENMALWAKGSRE